MAYKVEESGDDPVIQLVNDFRLLSNKNRRRFCSSILPHLNSNERDILAGLFQCDFIARLPQLPVEKIISYLDDDTLDSAIEVSKTWSTIIHSLPLYLKRRCEWYGVLYRPYGMNEMDISCSTLSRYLSLKKRFTLLSSANPKGIPLKSKQSSEVSACLCNNSAVFFHDKELFHWCTDSDTLLRQGIPINPHSLLVKDNFISLVNHTTAIRLPRVNSTVKPKKPSPFPPEPRLHEFMTPATGIACCTLMESPDYGSQASLLTYPDLVEEKEYFMGIDWEGEIFLWYWGIGVGLEDPALPTAAAPLMGSIRLEYMIATRVPNPRPDLQPTENIICCQIVAWNMFKMTIAYLEFSTNPRIGILSATRGPFVQPFVAGVTTYRNIIVLVSNDTVEKRTLQLKWPTPASRVTICEWKSLTQCFLESNLTYRRLVAAGEQLFVISGFFNHVLQVDVCSYASNSVLWRIPVFALNEFTKIDSSINGILLNSNWLDGMIQPSQLELEARFIFFVQHKCFPETNLLTELIGLRL